MKEYITKNEFQSVTRKMDEQFRYQGILLENLDSKADQILEVLSPLANEFRPLQQRVDALEQDVAILKRVATSSNS